MMKQQAHSAAYREGQRRELVRFVVINLV